MAQVLEQESAMALAAKAHTQADIELMMRQNRTRRMIDHIVGIPLPNERCRRLLWMTQVCHLSLIQLLREQDYEKFVEYQISLHATQSEAEH